MTEETRIDGLRDLDRKLGDLGKKLGIKTLRKAVRRAAAPVRSQIRIGVPIGTEAHKTFKGRLVAPTFLRRSIRLLTKLNRRRGSISAIIGVRREAFYGINFLDLGPHTITHRNGRPINRYTLRKRSWFMDEFIRNRTYMETSIRNELRRAINEAI